MKSKKNYKMIIKKKFHDIFSKKKELNKFFSKKREKVIIDYREKNSLVASYLVKSGFEIEFKNLKVGDYIFKDTIIERKTVPDFISSMISRRLINQIEELKQFKNKMIIIEGIDENELYNENSGINSNAVRGFILSIILKHKVPLIFSKNAEDTAKFIEVLSKKKTKEISLNVKKKNLSKNEQIQFILESFHGIGPKKSKILLKKFKTIQNIINASPEQLKEILGKSAETFKIVKEEYQ